MQFAQEGEVDRICMFMESVDPVAPYWQRLEPCAAYGGFRVQTGELRALYALESVFHCSGDIYFKS